MPTYSQRRKFDGKWFTYEGFTSNQKDAVKRAQEIRQSGQNGQNVRIVKLRNGEYNLYSRSRR